MIKKRTLDHSEKIEDINWISMDEYRGKVNGLKSTAVFVDLEIPSGSKHYYRALCHSGKLYLADLFKEKIDQLLRDSI